MPYLLDLVDTRPRITMTWCKNFLIHLIYLKIHKIIYFFTAKQWLAISSSQQHFHNSGTSSPSWPPIIDGICKKQWVSFILNKFHSFFNWHLIKSCTFSLQNRNRPYLPSRPHVKWSNASRHLCLPIIDGICKKSVSLFHL